MKDKNITIISVYIEPDSLGDDFLINLEKTLTELKSPIILGF